MSGAGGIRTEATGTAATAAPLAATAVSVRHHAFTLSAPAPAPGSVPVPPNRGVDKPHPFQPRRALVLNVFRAPYPFHRTEVSMRLVGTDRVVRMSRHRLGRSRRETPREGARAGETVSSDDLDVCVTSRCAATV